MILNQTMRPLEKFDPSNKKHRQLYTKAMADGTWGTCPVRFYVEGDSQNNNLAYAMQRKLNEYYTQKEFGLVSRFADKTVDKQAA